MNDQDRSRYYRERARSWENFTADQLREAREGDGHGAPAPPISN